MASWPVSCRTRTTAAASAASACCTSWSSRAQGLDRVFVLTTQTAHWFVEQGFEERSRDALPHKKQALYNLQRNSKVFFKTLAT